MGDASLCIVCNGDSIVNEIKIIIDAKTTNLDKLLPLVSLFKNAKPNGFLFKEISIDIWWN